MSLDTQAFLRIGDEAPNFTAETSTGSVTWHDYINGKWAILFSHPRDFTPVCTTEIAKVAQLKSAWEKKNTVVAVVSADDVDSHKKWITEIEKVKKCKITFPIIGDEKRAVSAAYGMLDQTHMDADMPMTVRSVFFIGPDKKIKLILTYPASTGRNFTEVIRCLDSLQLAVSHKVATPADWTIGQDCCILPTVSDEEAATFKDMKVVSAPCKLRMVPCPIGGGDKKAKGGKKGGDQPKKDKKQKGDDPEELRKKAEKKLKAVIKEGGKKGQDVEGMCAMGNKAANVNLEEPAGSMELLKEALKAMNKEVDPEGEDRKGGAGDIPKMIVSSGELVLSALVHVPESAKDIINLQEWATHVFGCIDMKPSPTDDEHVLQLEMKADVNAGRFPLKDRDVLIGRSFSYMTERHLIVDDDSEDEDYSGAANLGAHTGGDDY